MIRLLSHWFNPRSDLQLENDRSSRFLPWMIAPMLFLASLALIIAFILAGLLGRWERSIHGTLTVEVPVASGLPAAAAAQTREQVDLIVRLLEETPGVLAVHPFSDQQISQLLAPWLGDGAALADLPIPALIDVQIADDVPIDDAALTQSLGSRVPGVRVDDHRHWMGRLIRMGRLILGVALGAVGMITGLGALTVIFAVRSGLETHRADIDLLHLLGAADAYIAQQFARRMAGLTAQGALLAFVPTVPVLGIILWPHHDALDGLLTSLHFPIIGWIVIALLPVIAATLAYCAAWQAVHHALSRTGA